MAALAETLVRDAKDLDYDAIIIGAGISGLYQLYRLRELGLRARVFEAGTGVGGTWYWNRYPGARFDSESYSYGFCFSQELLDEWHWTEHFSPQPQTLRYLNHVADKFDLRRDIQFRSRVAAAHYSDEAPLWSVTLEDGSQHTARFLITAIGPLSAPTMPRIEGIESFQGRSCHTARWPHQPVSFEGKRVAVIGTGATGVQTIQEVAKTVGHLTVFQRTPNWCAPLHNAEISKEEMAEIRGRYPEIFARCRETFACFLHTPDPRATSEVTAEEREAVFEKLYNNRGFGMWRVPLETKYYEVYNQPNVKLVDINETPIERITPTGIKLGGIKTSDAEYEFDIIIYATGFDAITGAFDRIDIRGVDRASLKEKWQDGPQTFLGILVDDFPNMLMVMGPHAGLGNFPRAAEYSADWVTGLIRFARDRGLTRIEATAAGANAWTDHVIASSEGLLFTEVDSWMTGINRNVEGKQVRRIMRYSGGHPAFREHCEAVVVNGYRELTLA